MFARLDEALDQRAKGIAAAILPFYRRFPYEGPLGLFKVDPRGAYSPLDGFFFNRIPKAANSTVMAVLAGRARYRKPFAGTGAKQAFLRPSRLTPRQVTDLAERAFKFTVVRDPYRRALSAFADKIVGRKSQSAPFYDWLGGDDGRAPDFGDFARFLADGGAQVDSHWAPQTQLLLLPVAKFDFIGRVESLDADLTQVMQRIFGDEGPVAVPRRGPASSSRSLSATAFTPEVTAILDRVYAEDFEVLGYPRRSERAG